MNVTELVEQYQQGEQRCQEFVDAVFILERHAHILENNAALVSLRSERDVELTKHNDFCAQPVFLGTHPFTPPIMVAA